MNETDLLLPIVFLAVSGLPALLFPRRNAGAWFSFLLTLIAAVSGIHAAIPAFAEAAPEILIIPWGYPLGDICLQCDALSAAFLLPIFLLSVLTSLYGLEYWKPSEHPENGGTLRFFFGILTASMALLVVAAGTFVFLLAWETMALAAYFVLTAESDREEVRQTGWIYLVATHTGTLAIFAFFALFQTFNEEGRFLALAPGLLTSSQAGGMFLLALFGFGMKAGVFPLHVWLPSAHANAPSHVSAFFSGVFIKMGVYGLLRAVWLLPQPPLWWGVLLLLLGIVSGLFGIAFAIGQHDIKRLLAYSSIENIGLIFIAIGVALIGEATGNPSLAALGIAGAILHVWNHSLFKAMLFLSAGSVIHQTHTRQMDRLGGLAKRMPVTAFVFLLGTVSICGLPPLNGFVSELLIYLGLFSLATQPGDTALVLAALAAPAVALIGGLALLCFVKTAGTVFLGEPRTSDTANAREAGWAMKLPMAVLTALCLLIGLLPGILVPALDSLISLWTGSSSGTVSLTALAPFDRLSQIGFGLLLLIAVGYIFLRRAVQPTAEPLVTWSCGYLAASARVQYTSSSFAQTAVDLFRWALIPRRTQPRVEGLFPTSTRYHSHVPDILLDRLVLPFFTGIAWVTQFSRFLQYGQIQVYVLYIFVTLFVLLVLI